MVDFDCCRPISSGISEGGRKKKREKKRRTWRFLHLIRRAIRHLRTISSPHAGRRNIFLRREKERVDIPSNLRANMPALETLNLESLQRAKGHEGQPPRRLKTANSDLPK
ncbi:hypothetical protein GW17_00027111 [Ensete ventricosum]|nr:hypothetical protein GW17_00027111 [Ensete ventricosum]